MSDLVNEAVQLSLAEDAEDLAAFEDRVNEPALPCEDVVKDFLITPEAQLVSHWVRNNETV